MSAHILDSVSHDFFWRDGITYDQTTEAAKRCNAYPEMVRLLKMVADTHAPLERHNVRKEVAEYLTQLNENEQ